jgi:hypothetical protein
VATRTSSPSPTVSAGCSERGGETFKPASIKPETATAALEPPGSRIARDVGVTHERRESERLRKDKRLGEGARGGLPRRRLSAT